MRIAVDLVYFTGRKGGTETYAQALYTALGRVFPEVELIALVNTEAGGVAPDWFPGEAFSIHASGENRIAWALAENVEVPLSAARIGADVLHCPANFGPALSRVPVVLTVHDLLGFRYPELVVAGGARVVQMLTRTSVRGARKVLTDSDASAADLRNYLSVPGERISVVPLAAWAPGTASPRPIADRPSLLSTGNRMPHKNFETLLRALASIPHARRPRLIIPGSHGADPLRPLVDRLGLHDDVDLLGWVSTEELDRLYRQATMYVLPSRFEGFGLPVLEAMVRGCPVLCSDIPVLRELGGTAAVYSNTGVASVLAQDIHRVVWDTELLATLHTAGLARAASFSWERTARATFQVLQHAANGP